MFFTFVFITATVGPLPPPVLPKREEYAVVSAYSKEETCPNWECKAANGTKPVVRKTTACPRAIKLGTLIEFDGKKYTCNDRTALKHDGRYDLFVENRKAAMDWGLRRKLIKIY